MTLLSIILLLLVMLVRADVVITSTVDDYVLQQRRLQEQQSLDSNPQFYTPPQQPQQQQQQSLEASNVFGLLFNVRSKVDEEIQITGFEFYTAQADISLYYQLYTKEGEFWEDGSGATVIGRLDALDLISQGTFQGSSNCTDTFQGTALYCTLSVVPDEGFIESQWTISENMSSRSFYITLTSRHLVVQGNTPILERADERVVASTPDLELYGGIGTNAYPVTRDAEYLYGTSLGFIGKIHYENDDPQLVQPLPATTITQQPTQSPTTMKTLPTIAPQSSPTISPQEPSESPTTTPQESSESPTLIETSPTPKPTRPKCRPGRPCLTPPKPDTGDIVTSMPTTSPTTIIRTIVYIENTPQRAMGPRDRSKYIEVMTKFLDQSTSLKNNDVTPMNITVVNDDLIEEPEDKKKGPRRLGSSNNLKKKRSLPNDNINATDSYSYYYNELGGRYVPKTYPAIFVQTEFIVRTNLPYDVAAFYLWNEFRTNEEELVSQFHNNAIFISYFREIQNVTVQMVNELIAPTAAPTVFIENTTIIESENTAPQSFENIWLYLGVTLGVVWFVLTCCSLRHILNHRRGKRYRDDLRRLTYQYSTASRDKTRMTITLVSPKEVFNRLSSVLTRSKHRKSGDEENPSSEGDSLDSFG
mmetsp:Transcript_4109/g.8645  ORF Transcript_4109/g.8645 Transcript_4109/m.8645 type:complete len:644 (-) Transcript_4109:2-1933(-)